MTQPRLTLVEAVREAREVLEEMRDFIVENNGIVDHARKEPLNDTWIGVHRRRTADIARSIDGLDEVLRVAIREEALS